MAGRSRLRNCYTDYFLLEIIVLKKASGDSASLRIRQYKKGAAPKDMDATMPKAKKIKFDED